MVEIDRLERGRRGGPALKRLRARPAASARPRGDEPDARHPRMPARASCTRRSTRCRCGRSSAPRWRCASKTRSAPRRRDHDPARRLRAGARSDAAAGRRDRRADDPRAPRETDRLRGRDDDRAAARLPDRRQDRQARRLLQLRHQRPHPDRARVLTRRRREHASSPATSSSASSTAARSRRSTFPASGALVQTAVEHGRAARPDIKLGICGEHGGDPDSIAVLRRRRASTT